jgi:Protein of unknown function (DUF2510)
MAQSGWYDDPDGTVGRLRYWDGTQWTTDTMPRPDQTAVLPPVTAAGHTAVLPPVVGAPTVGPPYGPAGTYGQSSAYGQYGPQGWTPTAQPPNPYAGQGPAQPPRRKMNPLVALGVLVLLVGVVAGAYTLTRPQTPNVTPTTRPSGQVSLPSAFPTVSLPQVTVPEQSGAPTIPDTSDAPPAANCPAPASGQLTDGTISATMPASWKQEGQASISWSDCFSLGGREVVANWMTSAIVANYLADGGTSKQVAEAAWTWNVNSNYEGGTSNATLTGNKVTSQEVVTVGGKTGYKVSGPVTISGVAGVPGDDVTILVLENADKSHSILLTTSVIGDAASKAEVDALWASLKVG